MAKGKGNTSGQEGVVTTEKKVTKKKIGKDDMVKVMNNTFGELIYINQRTHEGWRFKTYGDTDEMSLGELLTMKTSQPKFINDGWILILDDEAIEYMGLQDLYGRMLKPEQIDVFYTMNAENMKNFLEKAPDSMRLLIANITRDKVRNMEFGDIFKIRLMESVLNCQILEE